MHYRWCDERRFERGCVCLDAATTFVINDASVYPPPSMYIDATSLNDSWRPLRLALQGLCVRVDESRRQDAKTRPRLPRYQSISRSFADKQDSDDVAKKFDFFQWSRNRHGNPEAPQPLLTAASLSQSIASRRPMLCRGGVICQRNYLRPVLTTRQLCRAIGVIMSA